MGEVGDKRGNNLVKFCQAWLIGLETEGGGGSKDPVVDIRQMMVTLVKILIYREVVSTPTTLAHL